MPRSRVKRSVKSVKLRARMQSMTQSRIAKAADPESPEASSVSPEEDGTPCTPAPTIPSVPSLSTAPCTPALTVPPVPSSCSASKRKLDYFAGESVVSPPSGTLSLPTTILDLNCLHPLFEGTLCTVCGSPVMLREGSGSKGFAVHLQLICSSCSVVVREVNTSEKTDRSSAINRSIVATGLTMGLTHTGLQKLSEGMGMPGLHHYSYLKHIDTIFGASQKVASVILSLSRLKVQEFYRAHFPDAFDGDVLNLAVSFDGSWPKRGHTSKLGFGAVIDLHTGLVVDFHVMSLHCQLCSSTGQTLRKRSEAIFQEWLVSHKESGNCQQNYEGSSGGMEVAAALEMWKRSLGHNMRYTTLLGDGDTKTFAALVKEKPYGEMAVQKEECVNHVSKRLNSGLRNLKTNLSKKSVRIGGNAKGSLTDPKIGLLQSYYTKAVRGNDTVEGMSKAIWATYHHSTGKHDDCPEGGDSWCWYQRDLAAGVEEPSLGKRTQSTALNALAAEHVKGVYERLTDPALLNRCLLGKTQNTNESLHSLIWLRCPKHLWSGYKKVFIACLLGVGEFNMGSLAVRIFLDGVGCSISDRTVVLGERRDRKRVKKADEAMQEVAKRRREVRKCAQQKEQERYEEMEGGPSYVPGGF